MAKETKSETAVLFQAAATEMAAGLDVLMGEMEALAEVIPSLVTTPSHPLTPEEIAARDADCEAQFDNMPV